MNGILLVDKPPGPTSHDAVEKVRRALGERRIGHAGTLDPPAEGLLVLAVGKAVKVLQYMEDHDKEYEFTVRFGRATDTDDMTGKVLREVDPSGLDRGAVEHALERFRDEISQVPPRYSSVKVDGKRMHRAARRGETLKAPARRVRVRRLELVKWDPPTAALTALCSKGTYVRALARDLGEALGIGACVEHLRRLASGPFRVEDAVPLDLPPGELKAALLPVDAGILHLESVRLSEEDARAFSHGRVVRTRSKEGLVRVYSGEYFIGVAESDGDLLRPRKVLGTIKQRPKT